MYKLVVVAVVLGVVSAKPSGILASAALAAPVAYAAPAPVVAAHAIHAAPLAYAAPTPAITYAAAPAIAYAAPAATVVKSIAAPLAVPAPVTYATGVQVSYHAEPVEQHGYKIVY